MAKNMISIFNHLSQNDDVRVVVVTGFKTAPYWNTNILGAGAAFCAGADLNATSAESRFPSDLESRKKTGIFILSCICVYRF